LDSIKSRILKLAHVVKSAQDNSFDVNFNQQLKQSYSPFGNNIYYKEPNLASVLSIVMQSPTGSSVLSAAGSAVMQGGEAVGIGVEQGFAPTGGVARIESTSTDDGTKINLRVIEINPSGSLIPGLYQKISSMFPNLDENNRRNLVSAYVLVHELAHHASAQLEGEGTAEQKADQFLEDAKNIFVNYVAK
jgi:hypothetical protein